MIFKEDDIYLYRDAIYDMDVGSGAGINAIGASDRPTQLTDLSCQIKPP